MWLIRYLNLFRTNTILSHLPCWHRSGRLFQAPIRTLLLTDNRSSWTTFGQMAEMANDPDSQYFEVLKNGVPLRVREPPLKSPGIWPTKEELKGESPLDAALEDPRGRGNYASAETFRGYSEDIFGGTGYGHGTWSRKRHPSVDVAYRNYAQVLWQLLMKETRFVPSMMDLGEVQMPTSRPTPTNALQPPQSWTASMAFTGCRHHRKSLATRNSPMHIGIGPNKMTSGCS